MLAEPLGAASREADINLYKKERPLRFNVIGVDMSKIQIDKTHSLGNPKLKPVFVVMPDYGQSYLWRNRRISPQPLTHELMGATAKLERKISERLHREFQWWQRDFEDAFEVFTNGGLFDWVKFHNKGVMLAVKLKQEIGDSARVYYEKPFEDPNCNLNEIREVLPDGRLA